MLRVLLPLFLKVYPVHTSTVDSPLLALRYISLLSTHCVHGYSRIHNQTLPAHQFASQFSLGPPTNAYVWEEHMPRCFWARRSSKLHLKNVHWCVTHISGPLSELKSLETLGRLICLGCWLAKKHHPFLIHLAFQCVVDLARVHFAPVLQKRAVTPPPLRSSRQILSVTAKSVSCRAMLSTTMLPFHTLHRIIKKSGRSCAYVCVRYSVCFLRRVAVGGGCVFLTFFSPPVPLDSIFCLNSCTPCFLIASLSIHSSSLLPPLNFTLCLPRRIFMLFLVHYIVDALKVSCPWL